MIAALFVLANGPYSGRADVDLWPESRDARLYPGPHSVVAHPPCARWGRLWAMHGRKLGDDQGCFESALASVRRFGGVLEHPAGSFAWPRFGLLNPVVGAWSQAMDGSWTTEVDQGLYGHPARKRTWLLYVGATAPPLFGFGIRLHRQAGRVRPLRRRDPEQAPAGSDPSHVRGSAAGPSQDVEDVIPQPCRPAVRIDPRTRGSFGSPDPGRRGNMDENERWAPMPNTDGVYEVSDRGRVRTWRTRGRPRLTPLASPFILKSSLDANGYVRLNLKVHGVSRHYPVHRAVLTAFGGPPPDPAHSHVAHTNGDPADNRLCNLRWVSPKENAADTIRHGRLMRGSSSHLARLTEETVAQARVLYRTGVLTADMAALFSVTPSTMLRALTGKTWSHVTEPPCVIRSIKITALEVNGIRRLLEAGVAKSVIAARFGISPQTVAAISTRKIWHHI